MSEVQRVFGNKNVQIQNVTGSNIRIVYNRTARLLPLEPAEIPIGEQTRSPARMLRARSGVIPYTVRQELRTKLQIWCHSGEPFAARVIGGSGGAGKTRLGVQLCVDLAAFGWLSGLLATSADQGAFDALVTAPTPRLVVIDYAETRSDQLTAIPFS